MTDSVLSKTSVDIQPKPEAAQETVDRELSGVMCKSVISGLMFGGMLEGAHLGDDHPVIAATVIVGFGIAAVSFCVSGFRHQVKVSSIFRNYRKPSGFDNG